jgi:hypothetical protein
MFYLVGLVCNDTGSNRDFLLQRRLSNEPETPDDTSDLRTEK